ncbi:THO complex subunit 2, partial [Biomphalaria glabrata]
FRRDYKCIISTPVILFRNTVETYDPELSKRRKSEDHYLASRKQNGEANGSSKMYVERDYKEKSKQQSHSSKSK